MLRTKAKTRELPIQIELPGMAAVPPMPTGLKGLLGPGVKIGCALGSIPANPTAPERSLLLSQFDALTPENCMKPGPIQPTEGHFHFTEPDALVELAQQNGMEVTGHCLVWHQQYPRWFFNDGDVPASRELVLARLRAHITTVMHRYRGRITGWDVVNEAVADHGSNMLRHTPWTESVGDDFVEQAFRIAHEANPHAELYYNDFNIELPAKRAKALKLLRQLMDAGVRIDGVGIQGHWVLNQVPYTDIEDAIGDYHRLGLKVMITELDLDIMDRPDCGADVSWQSEAQRQYDPYALACPPEVISAHADQYARLFEIFAKHADKLSRVSFWGLHDGVSWLNNWPWKRRNFALLFDRDCQPKTAYHEVVNRVAAMAIATRSNGK
jgi:endo-1,4-beta-xylanase